MRKVLFLILCTAVTFKCYAEINFDYCLQSWPKTKSKAEEHSLFVMKKLISVTSFNDLKKLQSDKEDGFNSLILLTAPMASSDINGISILELAKTRYLTSYYFKNNQKKIGEHIKPILDGKMHGFDGSLFNLFLSAPQASFLLYDEKLGKTDNNSKNSKNNNSESEAKLLELLINDETTNYFKDKNETTHEPLEDLPKYSAIEITNTYSENEVKGDLKFKRKQFAVYGTVDSIRSSIDDKPMVIYHSKDQFPQTTAFFNERAPIARIAEIKKDKLLNLVCFGGGEVSGSPLLSECEFFDDYLREKLMSLSSNEQLSPIYDTKNISLSIKLIASLLPDNSACFTGNITKCKIDIFNIPIESMRAAANEYGLSRDIVKGNIRVMIDEFNREVSSNPRYDNEKVKALIKMNEACFVPAILKSF